MLNVLNISGKRRHFVLQMKNSLTNVSCIILMKRPVKIKQAATGE